MNKVRKIKENEKVSGNKNTKQERQTKNWKVENTEKKNKRIKMIRKKKA